MRKGILIVLVFSLLLIAACKVKLVCNEPYIPYGTDCCLDQNGNKICDKDEAVTTTTGETTTTLGATTTTLGGAVTPTTLKPEDRVTILGDKNAKVIVKEYGDFSEVKTRKFYDQVLMYKLKADYIDTGKIAFEYGHFVFTNNSEGKRAGEALECAADQGRYWAYYSLLTKYPDYLDDNDLKENARKLDLDRKVFADCLDTGKYAGKVASDYDEAVRLGGDKTPVITINGIVHVDAVLLSYKNFKSLVDAELAKKGIEGHVD